LQCGGGPGGNNEFAPDPSDYAALLGALQLEDGDGAGREGAGEGFAQAGHFRGHGHYFFGFLDGIGVVRAAGAQDGGLAGRLDAGNAADLNLHILRPAGTVDDLLYIADYNNNRVRKADANGIISTVGGNGIPGSSGDGGAATNANLNHPQGVGWDASSNLYVADLGNQRIRKVGANGIITTIAGNGGHIYSGDGGVATNASLDAPAGVALDGAGNLYIADSSNQRIRKVDANGIITTVAGNGTSGYMGDGGAATNGHLTSPNGVALDASGNLYIADYNNNRIRKADPNGVITTVAGGGAGGDGGAATNASLSFPTGVALDVSGNLYIADSGHNRIRKVNISGSPALNLTNVSANDAGRHTVVVASFYGSVTSAVATLTVTDPRTPPQIMASDASFGFLTNQFGFNLSGAVGQTIVVDGSTDLVN